MISGSQGKPIPLSAEGLICPSRNQLPMHLIFSMLSISNRNLSHLAVRLAPEKLRSGSADSAGIDRISIAIRLSRGYTVRTSSLHHY